MGVVRSRYNFATAVSDDRLAVYNSKTGAVMVSEPGQRATLQAVLNNPEVSCESNVISALISQGFLVEDDCDEIADIRSWYTAFVTDQRLVHITMLPAEACNFACPYCFQYNKRQILMRPWVYEATLRLIERIAFENRNNGGARTYVKVSWFGGEPTLAARSVLDFQRNLGELCGRFSIDARSTLVTNGYLLTPQLFNLFLDADIREFQVTLDGDKESHDQLRVLKGGKPTFDTIYGNLKEIAKLPLEFQFRMAIRTNFLRSTVSSVKKLIDAFVADFGCDPRFSIYCRPVYNFPTTRTDIHTVAPDICTLEEGLGLQNVMAVMVMERMGVSSLGKMFDPLPMPTPAWCPAERQYSYIVGADGTLFPCDNLVGDESYAIGRLSETGAPLYDGKFQDWKKSIFNTGNGVCLSCRLLPVCMGGCLRERIMSPERQPCLWREEDILWALREYTELSLASLPCRRGGKGPLAADNGRKEVRDYADPQGRCAP